MEWTAFVNGLRAIHAGRAPETPADGQTLLAMGYARPIGDRLELTELGHQRLELVNKEAAEALLRFKLAAGRPS
jgi:hypothetical protein